ncbi:adenylyl-sulfate kinase [Paenibacillus eucommiae]|uniref:Adenylyl-sulfate kinase n=1 Tax=Paenibacillus eucommiae TaxID=1355755 RepID=A0ABS4J0G6_9BACL|nr:adenylyl-sulfate kinase [Paenibacillus eucommiae]MBP1993338.1 adenylylsulfate kinase [Paenibacillus eucommiae]
MIQEANATTKSKKQQAGAVLWFTGLSGAGKTTTAQAVEAQLRERGCAVELLDGDVLRETICKGLGFSREERFENIKRIAYVAKLLSRNGVIVLVSAITPYREMRDYVRGEVAGFVEIYVKCSLEECERRDVKGLYAKARRGEVARFTGVSDPYEEPLQPEITLCTTSFPLEQNTEAVLSWLDQAAAGRLDESGFTGGY